MEEIIREERLQEHRKKINEWQREIKRTDYNRMEEIVTKFIDKNKNMTLESADWLRKFLEFYENDNE